MNAREWEMVRFLSRLKANYGAVGVKAEFEAEGTRIEELLRLKEISLRADMELALKIGGPEDVWGTLQALRIGVSDIVAPMVESAYGLRKYLEMIRKYVPVSERRYLIAAVNVETIQAYQGIYDMMAVGKELGLDSLTVGRVDLAGSMGLSRQDIDTPRIGGIVHRICEESKKQGFRTTVGGSIESRSRPFIDNLARAGILDRFETRKIVFGVSPMVLGPFEEAVRDAHRFELMWLENKRAHYGAMYAEDEQRIAMLRGRVGEDK